MDDQRNAREDGLRRNLPRYRIQSLLFVFVLLAIWLFSARLEGAGRDLQVAVLLTLTVAGASSAMYSAGRRRAFWTAFTVSLVLSTTGVRGYSLNLLWLDVPTGQLAATLGESP